MHQAFDRCQESRKGHDLCCALLSGNGREFLRRVGETGLMLDGLTGACCSSPGLHSLGNIICYKSLPLGGSASSQTFASLGWGLSSSMIKLRWWFKWYIRGTWQKMLRVESLRWVGRREEWRGVLGTRRRQSGRYNSVSGEDLCARWAGALCGTYKGSNKESQPWPWAKENSILTPFILQWMVYSLQGLLTYISYNSHAKAMRQKKSQCPLCEFNCNDRM